MELGLAAALAGGFVLESLTYGKSASELGLFELLLRAAVVYGAGLLIVRVSESRFLGSATAFDAVLGFLLGSLLSRAINGGAPVAGSLAAGLLLVVVHKGLAFASYRWHPLGVLIKGRPRRLVRDGQPDEVALRRSHISEHDLREGLRVAASTDDLSAVRDVVLERNGQITAIKRSKEPHVVEVRVAEGVQVVRIEIAP